MVRHARAKPSEFFDGDRWARKDAASTSGLDDGVGMVRHARAKPSEFFDGDRWALPPPQMGGIIKDCWPWCVWFPTSLPQALDEGQELTEGAAQSEAAGFSSSAPSSACPSSASVACLD